MNKLPLPQAGGSYIRDAEGALSPAAPAKPAAKPAGTKKEA